MKHDEFWIENGQDNVTPYGKRNPEGWDVSRLLSQMAQGSVIDIGCGYGRLCESFDPETYLGVDINRALLRHARALHPAHKFTASKKWKADTAILYTVLLHVADDDLAEFIERIDADRVIVAEVMGRSWRRDGNPPVYNREASEYVEAFKGWKLTDRQDHPYKHYFETNITFLVFDRC